MRGGLKKPYGGTEICINDSESQGLFLIFISTIPHH